MFDSHSEKAKRKTVFAENRHEKQKICIINNTQKYSLLKFYEKFDIAKSFEPRLRGFYHDVSLNHLDNFCGT